MFRNSFVLVLAAVLGSVSIARADVGPKPRAVAPGMEARSKDMPGVGIEMSSEEVSVKLVAGKKRSEQLVVEASFKMTNPGEAVEIEEGFPVGPVMNMKPFSVELDGKKVDFDLVDLVSGKKADPGREKGEYHDYWYVWKASYRAKSCCVHTVKYTVSYSHPFYTMVDTGYILHTGAPWKGAIGRARVTFAVEGMSPDHVYSVSPRKGLKRDGDTCVWEFENLEPSADDDIRIHYDCERPWGDAVREAREGCKKGSWWARQRLVDLLESAPFHGQRTQRTEEEHAEYVRTLVSLFSEAHELDGRWVLPGNEDEVKGRYWQNRRLYAGGGDGADALFKFLRNACDAVEARPDDPAARAMLSDFVALAGRFQKGHLYADGYAEGPVAIEFGQWGDHEAQARKRLEGNLARARGLLGTK